MYIDDSVFGKKSHIKYFAAIQEECLKNNPKVFHFSDDALELADYFRKQLFNYSDASLVLSLAKLPAKSVWLEFNCQPQQLGISVAFDDEMQKSASTSECLKFGILVTEVLDDDGKIDSWIMASFSKHKGNIHASSFFGIVKLSTLKISENGSPAFTVLPIPQFVQDLNISKENIGWVCQNGVDIADVTISLIAMLNSKNIFKSTLCDDLTKINKKRRILGKRPLLEYQTITIADELKRKMATQSIGDGMNRLHFRRGHFKVRKTGVFWWNPHMAGNKEQGEVISNYSVEA